MTGDSSARIATKERLYIRKGRAGLDAAVEDLARSGWRAMTQMPGFGEWDAEVFLSFRSEMRRALIRHVKAVRVRRESRAPERAAWSAAKGITTRGYSEEATTSSRQE